MSGPIRQILVDGKPTTGRMDDTHIWGAGGLLTGAPSSGGAARYAGAEAAAAERRDAEAERLAAVIYAEAARRSGRGASGTEGPTVWTRGDWRILAERNVNGSPLYRPVNDRTGYTDWPSWRPWADTVAFDRPGALPAYVRAAVLRLYRAADPGAEGGAP